MKKVGVFACIPQKLTLNKAIYVNSLLNHYPREQEWGQGGKGGKEREPAQGCMIDSVITMNKRLHEIIKSFGKPYTRGKGQHSWTCSHLSFINILELSWIGDWEALMWWLGDTHRSPSREAQRSVCISHYIHLSYSDMGSSFCCENKLSSLLPWKRNCAFPERGEVSVKFARDPFKVKDTHGVHKDFM